MAPPRGSSGTSPTGQTSILPPSHVQKQPFDGASGETDASAGAKVVSATYGELRRQASLPLVAGASATFFS